MGSVPEGLEKRGLALKGPLFCQEETWTGCPIDLREERPACRPDRVVSWSREGGTTGPGPGVGWLGDLGKGREVSRVGRWVGPVHQAGLG